MRTSPPPMRLPRLWRATALPVVAVLLLGAACGDDGDEPAAPTTTAPATTEAPAPSTEPPATTDEGGSTTVAPTTTPSAGSIPPAEGITPAYVEAVFGELMEELRAVLLRAQRAGRFDEVYFRELAMVFTSQEGRRLTSGIQQNGGIDGIRADAQPVPLGAAELVDATPACVSFTMDPVDLGPLLTFPFEGTKRGSVRLVPAPGDSSGSPWRINFLDRFEGTQLHPGAECTP